MNELQLLAPHLVDQTVYDRWPRRSWLLTVVASRTLDGDSWTALGTAALMSYGRTAGEARWDHELLKRMATSDRILLRESRGGRGQRADLYRLRGNRLEDVVEWRHVPWKKSARTAILLLRAMSGAVRSGEGAVLAGQSGAVGAVTPPDSGVAPTRLSTKQPRPLPNEPRPLPKSPAQNGPGTAPTPEDPAPSLTMPLRPFRPLYLKPPSLPVTEAEGGREEELRNDHQRLTSMISDVLERPVTGTMSNRVLVVLRAYPDQFDVLAARVERFRGMHVVEDVVKNLESWALLGGGRRTSERALDAKRTNLLRLIRTVEDTDPDYAATLREELDALCEEPVTDTPRR